MKNLILILVGASSSLVVGCASAPKTRMISDIPIDSQSKDFVLLTSTTLDNDFRVEMTKHHFKIKKFASVETAIESDRTFNRSAARYGISIVKIKRVDWCPWNDQEELNVQLEISDLQKNEVLMTVEATNWTAVCGPFSIHSKYLFEQLTDEIEKNWAPKTSS